MLNCAGAPWRRSTECQDFALTQWHVMFGDTDIGKHRCWYISID
jgi:hypothetical protein